MAIVWYLRLSKSNHSQQGRRVGDLGTLASFTLLLRVKLGEKGGGWMNCLFPAFGHDSTT